MRYNSDVVRKSLVMTTVVAVAACSRQNVDLSDRGCTDGSCVPGYVCNPLTATCVGAIDVGCDGGGAICPDTVHAGDACSPIGAFLPCPGASNDTCENGGCRTCMANGTWSDCTCVNGDACICAPTNGGVEICDGYDNDCNTIIDDAADDADGCTNFWPDGDHDGYGDSSAKAVCACSPPNTGDVANGDDTNDSDPDINPGAGEHCNGIDDNGDQVIPANETDDDGDHYVECPGWDGTIDGVIAGDDCDDTDDQTHPNAATELCDGIANTCILPIPADELDGDDDGWVQCTPWNDRKARYPEVLGGGDCEPSNASINPGVDEIYNGADENCVNGVDECIIDCACGDDLFACYRLETTNPAMVDDSPNHTPGSISSKSDVTGMLVTGKIGNAYHFSSSNWCTSDDVAVQDVQHFTITAWIKADSLPTDGNPDYIVDGKQQYTMRADDGGTLTCGFWDVSSYLRTAAASNVLTTGSYIHVGCTYDGTIIIAYVNGNAVATTATTDAIRTNQSRKLAIGDTALNAIYRVFDGIIDHVQLFNQAHSARQICLAAERTDCP